MVKSAYIFFNMTKTYENDTRQVKTETEIHQNRGPFREVLMNTWSAKIEIMKQIEQLSKIYNYPNSPKS